MNQLFPGYGIYTPDPTLQLQNLQTQISRMQSPSQPITNPVKQLNRIKTKADVEKVIMGPNSTDVFFMEDDDVMFVKATDANNQATIRRFRFYEEEEVEPQYITVNDFNRFKAELKDEIKEEIINGQQFIRRYNESIGKHIADESTSAE